MWIVPKQLISASALDTEALISDFSEFSQVAEQSLMWRSKPSQSRTWSQRWKRETWMRHLSGRTLRHSQQNRFAAWWTSSLAATRANRSQQQVADSAQKTQDTSGRFYAEQYELFSPEESSSKTSKGTSRWDSPQSSATWKKMVTEQRGEYLARLKSEQATRERESSSMESWPTPAAHEPRLGYQNRNNGKKGTQKSLTTVVIEDSRQDLASHNSTGKNLAQWSTPDAQNHSGYQTKNGQVFPRLGSQTAGKLNPSWVEQLMDVPVLWTQLPTEWTDSDCLATELCQQQQQKHGQF